MGIIEKSWKVKIGLPTLVSALVEQGEMGCLWEMFLENEDKGLYC